MTYLHKCMLSWDLWECIHGGNTVLMLDIDFLVVDGGIEVAKSCFDDI